MPQRHKGSQRAYRHQTSSYAQVVFTTGADNLAAVLGPLEAVVMEGLWMVTVTPTSVKRLKRTLEDMGQTTATSTIQTTLNRLVEKGWVRRFDPPSTQGSRGQTYAAVLDESAFRCHIVTALLGSLPAFAAPAQPDHLTAMLHAALGTVRRLAQLAEAEVQIEVDPVDGPLADLEVMA